MQDELLFHGTLIEYWQLIYAEWSRYNRLGQNNPLHISHQLPPGEFEEVVLEFLDDYFQYPVPERPVTPAVRFPQSPKWIFPPAPVEIPVTLTARANLDDKNVRLTVQITPAASKREGRSALLRWKELRQDWNKKGLLGESAGPRSLPQKPKSGASLEEWFVYRDQMQIAGYRYSLKDVAKDSGYGYAWVKKSHAKYARLKD